jgi:hypothetical protein
MAVLNLVIMYEKIKFVLTCTFILFIQFFFAQVTITIPNENPPTNTVSVSSVEGRKPLGSYFGYERAAFIYRHAELGMYGQITGIAFYCDSVNNPGNVPLNIYVRETSDSAFTATTTVANEEAGATLVYTGTIQATLFAKNQWVSINFNTPFIHATSKPVEFIFETNASGSGSEGVSGKFFSHYNANPNYYTTQYWDQDNTPPTNNGIVANCKPNAQITMAAAPTCSGMPNAGTIVSSASDSLCLNESFVLSLQGSTPALGLTYQWQGSADGVTFTNIPQADSTTLLQSLQNTTWYRCAVTCSGQTAYSTIKQVVLRYFMKCYCNNLGGDCSNGTAIDSVAIEGTTLANGLTGCSNNNYTLYPTSGNTTTSLDQGSTYILDTRFNGNVAASFWIDYNQDGILESLTEWTQICTQSPSIYDTVTVGGVLISRVDSVFKTSFTVPSNAQIGYTLFRVRSRAGGNTNDSSSVCAFFGTGETEDYYVYINYPLGIQQLKNSEFPVSIYPNPVTNQITLEANFTQAENITTSIYTINGGLVSQVERKYVGEPLTIDVSALDTGIYFVKISTKEYITTKKIIISK